MNSMHYSCIHSIVTSTLSGGDNQFVWMYRQAFNVISVTDVMPLTLLVHVEQYDHRSDEVDHLTSRQEVEIASAIFSP